MPIPAVDPSLAAARAAAGQGAWSEVRSHLAPGAMDRDGARTLLLAEACLRTGDPRSAMGCLQAASPLLEQTGDRPAYRRLVNMQGAAAFALGLLDDATRHFGSALELARDDGDALLTARAINNLGAIAALRGDTAGAIASYQLAIAAYTRLGNVLGLAESWHNLAISYRTRSDLADADEAERRATEFAGEAGNARLVAMAQVGRAEISLRRGEFAVARANASRAATVFGRLPDYLLQADALRVQAEASDRLRFPVVADTLLAQAYAVAREHEHRLQEAQILQTHAQIMRRRGNELEAQRLGIEARDAFRRLGNTVDEDAMVAFLAEPAA